MTRPKFVSQARGGRGGEKISCEEVENYVLRHPKIKNLCVVAMPDPTFGEKACAFVIPVEGERIDLEEIECFWSLCEIAKFKLPERLEVRVSCVRRRQDLALRVARNHR
jgi:non-ribosomal peptide synthetase component E (peptide arylation enzyme)